MKKRFSFVCIYLCLLTLLVCGAAELLSPDKGERLSESENRMLAAFPALSAGSVADGSFMSGFESYLSDAFPFRDGAADFTDAVMKLVRNAKRAARRYRAACQRRRATSSLARPLVRSMTRPSRSACPSSTRISCSQSSKQAKFPNSELFGK